MPPTLKKEKIALIGCGTMGSAILRVLLEREIINPNQVTGSDPVPEQRQELQTSYHIEVTDDNLTAVQDADIVILSVKPQVLPAVLSGIRGEIKDDAFLFSIVAGIPIQMIASSVNHPAVVRVMPNTPAQIGEGMSVWTASKNVTQAQRARAETILKSMGKQLYFEDETALDMATAVSGTGPTYVFLLMEGLVDAAVHLGFSRRNARQMVIQTVLGSVKYADQSNLHLAQLRNQVTSPGGTSAEAIYQMEKGGMRTVLSKAVWAAYQKSRHLGEKAQEPPKSPLKINSED
jgi:pyrroline-5-carboxylate reductase